MNLTSKTCIPCEAGGEPMLSEQIMIYAKDVPKWQVGGDDKNISRRFIFKDFKEAMNFVGKVAELAEREGHHPDITISYNKVTLTLTTHAVGGLTENDFIVAAKVDKIF